MNKWDQSLREHYSLVAVENEMIVGFGDIDKLGYLDRIYFVHEDYQGKGIGTMICNRLERGYFMEALSLMHQLQLILFLKKEDIGL